MKERTLNILGMVLATGSVVAFASLWYQLGALKGSSQIVVVDVGTFVTCEEIPPIKDEKHRISCFVPSMTYNPQTTGSI